MSGSVMIAAEMPGCYTRVMQIQIAAQLYTVREFTQTAEQFARTLEKLKAIGYTAVQISAIGPIDPAEVARLLTDNGLACCATHVSLDRIKKEPQKLIDELRSWNCRFTAVGGFFPDHPTLEDWHRFAHELNQASAAFTGSGIRLGYHNHSHELAKFGQTTALDLLVDQLDPAIFFEIDTYWITHGGGDPAAWIAKLPGRVPAVHLKDMGIRYPREQIMMEVGEGNLNWPAILSACQSAGVQWHIIEQDICHRDPFDSLAISLKNLKQMTKS